MKHDSISTQIYTPTETVPEAEVLELTGRQAADSTQQPGEKSTTINDYEDATKGEDDGYYTCVIYHGVDHEPTYSVDKCLVIIEDLCLKANCREDQICNADYDTGAATCECNAGCPFVFEPVCSNKCEQFLSECMMDVQICEDRIPREVASNNFCAGDCEVYEIEEEEEFESFSNPILHHTCTMYPGGAIDSFDGKASYYDMACTHVLAADFSPSGDIANPWFVYGTFDQLDGKTALYQMTFYLGRDMFVVERGWIVHQGGIKMALEEGVAQQIGGSDCTANFAEFHLTVDCPPFIASYDGVMSGHIVLKPGVEHPYSPIQKKYSNVGLCFDGNFGFRPNWQIGQTEGSCKVDVQEAPCAESKDECQLGEAALSISGVSDLEWTACGGGASVGCGELRCDGNIPTAMQVCAFEQANRINCAWKSGDVLGLSGSDVSCPTDPCTWMEEVASRGCPQEHLPFNCPA